MKQSKSAKKNYIYNLIYKIAVIIIPLVVTPYISRILEPEGVGSYSFASSIFSYFTLFANLGFAYYAQREIAKFQDDKEKQSKVFWEIQICKIIPVIIVVVIYIITILSGLYGVYTNLMWIFVIGLFSICLDITYFYNGNEEFKLVSIISLITKIIGTASIFIFVKDSSDLILYALINYLIGFVDCVILILFAKNKIKKVEIKELNPLSHLKGTLKLFIPTIAISLYVVFDKTLIGIITQSSYENGIYEQAEKIVKTLLTFVTALGTVMIPRNSHEISKGNKEKVISNLYKAIKFVWFLGLPMTVGVIIVSGHIVPWFLGDKFLESVLLMQILSFLILFIGVNNVFGLQYMIPSKKDKEFSISVICGAVCNLVLNIPFIYFAGAIGAAISTIISEFVVCLIMFLFLRKEISLKIMLKSSIKPLISSCIMGIVVYLLSLILVKGIIETIILFVTGLIVYSILMIVLKDSMMLEGLEYLKNKIKKKKTKNT